MVFGCVLRDDRDSSERLRRLIDPFSGRAQDGTATWVRDTTALAVATLLTSPGRPDSGLAIIEDENVVVALDGRIDNADALRRELDLPPETSSSETIAWGYAAWSESLFDRLIGEFAVLIWDRKASAFFAVRDALATRPLYYWVHGTALAVSSDVESFLNCREFERTPDDDMVVDYLLSRFRDPDRTFFQHARQVPGGHYLVVRTSGPDVRRYWYPPRRESDAMTTLECHHRFKELFEQAVKRRLVANTPVLIHVSGGLDSTSILSAAMRARSATAIRGVAAIHPGLDCDESGYIGQVSADLGESIETWDGTKCEPIDLFESAGRAPGARAIMSGGSLGDVEIARRDGARVILSGTGGDQLGTPTGVLQQTFASGQWRQGLRWTLGFDSLAPRARLKALAYGLWGLAPTSLRRAWVGRPRQLPSWLSAVVRQGASRPAKLSVDLEFASTVQRRHWEVLTSAQSQVVVGYIQSQASSWAVEVRFPFLDKDLVSFVLTIPFHRWPSPDGRQRIHRHALADILPPSTRAREGKAEFSSAFALRVRRSQNAILALFDRNSEWASAKYLERAMTIAMVESATSGAGDLAEAVSVWRFATVEAWLQRVLRYPPPGGESHAQRESNARR
jgi:asparagine synthase (glutamine-hydrolysing)